MKNANKLLALFALTLCTIASTFAVTKTWDGSSSTAWNNGANWSGSSVPVNGDDIVIPTGLTNYPLLSGNTTVRSITLNGGTFSTNSYTLSVTTSITINGGTFSANRNVTAASYSQSGGTYTGSGTTTLTIYGNMVFATGTFTAPGNVNANNFTQNSGTFNLGSRTLNVSNNYILNDGTFDAGTGTLDADDIDLNGGTLTIQGNKIVLGNNFTLDGALLEITGNNDIEIDDDFFFLSGSIDMNFNDLIIADDYTYSDGSIANNGDFIVADNIILDFTGEHAIGINLRAISSVTFDNGILVTSNSFLLIFDYSANASGMSATAHVKGPVRKNISGSNTTPTFTFPIGNGSVYAPLEISSYQNRRSQDYFIAEYFYGRHPNAGGSKASGIDHVSQAEYWMLDRYTTSGTATTTARVNLSYNSTNRSGSVTNTGNLIVVRWTGSQWENLGRNSGTGNTTSGSTTSSNRPTSFSPFTLGSTNTTNPLPITLLNFNALPVQNAVNVSWTTTSEVNNDFFTIEKSQNGTDWSAIATVDAVGNSEQLTNYAHLDVNPIQGVQYYRLKQTDINGDYTYSKVIAVKFESVATTVSIYPNPAKSTISIELSNDPSADVTINVLNSMGQVVMTANGIGSTQTLDVQNLNSGVYYIEIVTEGNVSRTKFLKN